MDPEEPAPEFDADEPAEPRGVSQLADEALKLLASSPQMRPTDGEGP